MHTYIFQVFLLLAAVVPTVASANTPPKITVYSYDAFCTKGGLGQKISELSQVAGITTECVPFSDTRAALAQVELEGSRTKADVVVGIDPSMAPLVEGSKLFAKLPKKIFGRVPKELTWDTSERFVTFDYSWLAFVYDSRKTPTAKTIDRVSLLDFSTKKGFDKRMVLEDPRTSSVGRTFLLMTAQLLGEKGFDQFWKNTRSKWLTIAPNWSTAYGMLLKNEVSFALSYTTSPAYHCVNDKTDAFAALLFRDGNILQAEAVGLVSTSSNRTAALNWIELLLSDRVQKHVATTQWMYPVSRTVALPACFNTLRKPLKSIVPSIDAAKLLSQKWIPRWVDSQVAAQ